MSLYNLLCGVAPATFTVLPMLGRHPDEYPRFRDCFTSVEGYPEYDDHIIVYTRTGGGNREDYEADNQAMSELPGYVTDFDDEFDSTYAYWVFQVPDTFRSDYEALKQGRLDNLSEAYKQQVYAVYPKIADKLKALFEGQSTSES